MLEHSKHICTRNQDNRPQAVENDIRPFERRSGPSAGSGDCRWRQVVEGRARAFLPLIVNTINRIMLHRI